MENPADPANLKMDVEPEPEFIKPARRIGYRKRFTFWLSGLWRLFKEFWIAVVAIVLGGLCYLLITHFVFLSVQVDGHSMVPSLEDSGHYWVNRMAYLRSDPHRSDIVALRDPRDGILVVKRIIALPGQSIYFNKGKVYLDGKQLAEPYLQARTYTFAYEKKSGDEFICVGKDQYFVMGDNRGNSTDSRVYGTVPRGNILGKLFFQ